MFQYRLKNSLAPKPYNLRNISIKNILKNAHSASSTSNTNKSILMTIITSNGNSKYLYLLFIIY